MKIKLLLLFFPIFLHAQSEELLSKMKMIDSRVKYVDSISVYSIEQTQNGETFYAHPRIDGKSTRRLFTNTKILKDSVQVMRILYKERHPETDEELSLYFSDSKLIYAELKILRGKKKKAVAKKFYYENDNLISPKLSTENINDDIYIAKQSKILIKQASS